MASSPDQPRERAVVFIDGNNFWHALNKRGVSKLGRLNFATISSKLVGPREWLQTRYYVGQVKNEGRSRAYNEQRSFLSFLRSCDSRISVHLGRIEAHTERNETAVQLKRYLANLDVKIKPEWFKDLVALGNATETHTVYQEKAVDVALAVDLVVMAVRDQYDTAYLLSADGDFTPAVAAAREVGKKVFAASPAQGAQLAAAVNSFIHMPPAWFDDCFEP